MRFISFLLLVCLASSAAALRINTEIKGVVTGYIDYLDYENFTSGPQEFVVNYVNSGSVGCRVRFEFDIMRGNATVYTAWTKESPLDAGGADVFRSFFLPRESGDYTAKVRIHSCNMVEDGPEFNFTAYAPAGKSLNPFNFTVDNDMEFVRIKVESEMDFEKVVVIPENYPIGWIVEPVVFNVTGGGVREVFVRYRPQIWHPERMSFVVVSGDGLYRGAFNYSLRENRGFDVEKVIVYMLIFVCLVLAAAIVFREDAQPKISQKRRKKGVIKSKI